MQVVKNAADIANVILTSMVILLCCSASQKQRHNRHLGPKWVAEVASDPDDSEACDC